MADPLRNSSRILTVSKHDRDFTGMKYLYPVVSRRAGGVSIGINLSTSNACNWRCEYCQVPDLARGGSPAVDFPQFDSELYSLTHAICQGSFLEDHAPPEARTLKDFALSGNGEPTSCPDFPEVVRRVGAVRSRFGLDESVAIVLITNGSLVQRASAIEGLSALAALGGEAWFKLDRGDDSALSVANGTAVSIQKHLSRLCQTSKICRTRVQSCWYTKNGQPPALHEVDAYVDCLKQAVHRGASLASVQLYTLARKPQMPGGASLGPVTTAWLSELAARVTQLGLFVDVSS